MIDRATAFKEIQFLGSGGIDEYQRRAARLIAPDLETFWIARACFEARATREERKGASIKSTRQN